MERKPKVTTKENVYVCEQYLQGKESISNLAKELKMYKKTIHKWIKKYKFHDSEKSIALDPMVLNDTFLTLNFLGVS